MTNEYGFSTTLSASYNESIALIKETLQKEGFGILTEIDVKATLKKKLDVDFKPYIILGACNPNLAYQGLQAEPELGLLLPCNVIVYDNGDGTSTVSIVDPIQMLGVVANPALQPIAEEANSRLRRALGNLSVAQKA